MSSTLRFHRNTEQVQLEWSSRGHLVQPPCWRRAPKVGCPRSCPDDFWVSPKMETPHFSAACTSACTLTAKKVFWYSDGTRFSSCAHCLFNTSISLFQTSSISLSVPIYSCDSNQIASPWRSTAWHSAAFSTDCFHLLSFISCCDCKFPRERPFFFFSVSAASSQWFLVYAWGSLTPCKYKQWQEIDQFKAPITFMLIRGEHSCGQNRKKELYHPQWASVSMEDPENVFIHGQKGYLIPYHQFESSLFLSRTSLLTQKDLMIFLNFLFYCRFFSYIGKWGI